MAKPKQAPDSEYAAKKEGLGRAQGEMARFYAKEVANDIEGLDRLIEPSQHSEARRIINLLIMHARGEAEFGLPSPVEEMLKGFRTESARSSNNKKRSEEQKQRRKHLRRLVEERLIHHPEESPAKVAAWLRRRNGFQDISRRTLEEDVKAVLKKHGDG